MEPSITVTIPLAALDDFWKANEVIGDSLGPASEDVFDYADEAYPRGIEVYDILREAEKNAKR
jgi:hypothetical protein